MRKEYVMPAWVWIGLVIWFILCLIAGVAYVIIHALRALRTVSDTSTRVTEPLAQLQSHEERDPVATVLQESYEDTRSRYLQTQMAKNAHKQQRRLAHSIVWKRWNNS